MGWADEARRLSVRANADTPADAQRARRFGAAGIGLCRTEHMFFGGERIVAMREMILAVDEDGRRHALAKLLPMQRQDFAELFSVMAGLPVTIRLLDPPLHEFLPRRDAELVELAADMAVPLERLHEVLEGLAETNPMLGHRGYRLGISYPEITEMQSRAVFEAACDVAAEGVDVHPQVMVHSVVGQEVHARSKDLPAPAAHRGLRAQLSGEARHQDRGQRCQAHREGRARAGGRGPRTTCSGAGDASSTRAWLPRFG